MRRILLLTGPGNEPDEIKRLISGRFANAAVDEVELRYAAGYLHSGADPDLIIYAPRSIGRLSKKFRLIKSLAGKARILVYSRFRKAEECLFDYLASGVNGILATSAHVSEQRRALDTVMRGDSFVDLDTRKKMLKRFNTESGHQMRRPIGIEKG